MATAMFAETLGNFQHSTRLIPESRSCTLYLSDLCAYNYNQTPEIGVEPTPETSYSEEILYRHSSVQGMFKDQRHLLYFVKPRNKTVSRKDPWPTQISCSQPPPAGISKDGGKENTVKSDQPINKHIKLSLSLRSQLVVLFILTTLMICLLIWGNILSVISASP
jgi:hypothetical protein